MGCLNSTGKFEHWFGNIHFSGPCNRSCFFCIGQHMLALDKENNLSTHPDDMPGLDVFIQECKIRNITDVNLTGTNTDPLLYRHLPALCGRLREEIPGLILGIRTNGVHHSALDMKTWHFFDKGSISIPSFDPNIYRQMMGGRCPDLDSILLACHFMPKINVVLGVQDDADLLNTLDRLNDLHVERVNLREPYGQAHIGDPLARMDLKPFKTVLGMPCYLVHDLEVTYWDVHFVEVESVNLYASGHVSIDYPISRGHDPVTGRVLDQSNWTAGRHFEQWRV